MLNKQGSKEDCVLLLEAGCKAVVLQLALNGVECAGRSKVDSVKLQHSIAAGHSSIEHALHSHCVRGKLVLGLEVGEPVRKYSFL